MPNCHEHKAQARVNQQLLEFLENSDFPDWIMTVSFYKALHVAESYFYKKKRKHYKSHVERVNNVVNDFEECEGKIWRSYMRLLDLSKDSRYLCRPRGWLESQVQTSREKLQIIEEEFAKLEKKLDEERKLDNYNN